jgi:succinoglycan biosynthesis transport protein ExoP
MNLPGLAKQIGRMLWARRLIVILPMASCLIGGYAVVKTVPPRYTSSARVEMTLLHGGVGDDVHERLDDTFAQAYVSSQVQLIRDYQVAGRVVDDLGWADNPDIQAAYAARPEGDDRDIRQWIAQQIINATGVTMEADSNILDIKYRAANPIQANIIAESIRRAYFDAVTAQEKEADKRQADWHVAQADQTQKQLTDLLIAKARYEHDSGVILQDKKMPDLDSLRLGAIASQVGQQTTPLTSAHLQATQQLADVDARLAVVSTELGANHPQVQDLRARRAALATEAAEETAVANAQASAVSNAAHAGDAMLEAQRQKILAERGKLNKVKQDEAEIDVVRSQYSASIARATELQERGVVGGRKLNPVGPAESPGLPDFPNTKLILGGTGLLGGGVGLCLALLMELLQPRVRGLEDLRWASPGTPILGTLPKFTRVARVVPRRRHVG